MKKNTKRRNRRNRRSKKSNKKHGGMFTDSEISQLNLGPNLRAFLLSILEIFTEQIIKYESYLSDIIEQLENKLHQISFSTKKTFNGGSSCVGKVIGPSIARHAGKEAAQKFSKTVNKAVGEVLPIPLPDSDSRTDLDEEFKRSFMTELDKAISSGKLNTVAINEKIKSKLDDLMDLFILKIVEIINLIFSNIGTLTVVNPTLST